MNTVTRTLPAHMRLTPAFYAFEKAHAHVRQHLLGLDKFTRCRERTENALDVRYTRLFSVACGRAQKLSRYEVAAVHGCIDNAEWFGI